MSHRTNLLQHRFEMSLAERNAREYDAERVALARARIRAGSYEGCKAIDNIVAEKIEPLVLTGPEQEPGDSGGVVQFGLVLGSLFVGFIIALVVGW